MIMIWEETIQYIRTLAEFNDLVEKAYFDENLLLNIERFGKSDEFFETLKIIKQYKPTASKIMDIGCGNGISAINFAIKGFNVTAVEPDKSDSVGAGAIKLVKDKLQLNNIEIFEEFAENINFPNNYFDIVYVRQAMHHANDLKLFLKECVRVLKPNGLLLTIRDHVIFDEIDRQWFLENHPLQKYYGGENAFTPHEYRNAIENAGGKIKKELKYYDSVLNYFPTTKESIRNLEVIETNKQKKRIQNKIGFISKLPFMWSLYKLVKRYNPLNEREVPGRMYSYIAIKK